MNWAATLILAIGMMVLASACSGDAPEPTPSPTGAASATATTVAPPTAEPTRVPPTVDPKAPRAKPSAADQATLATDPLVVYADEVAAVDSNSRRFPVVEVVSYNLRTGRIAGLFRVGDASDFLFASEMELAGRSIVMSFEHRIVVANLDGSGMRTLFTAPAGTALWTIAVSPDGRTIALSVESENLADPSLSSLVFVDLRTGNVVRRIGQPAFAAVGLVGSPGVRRWTADGKSVRVFGILHRDADPHAPGAIAGLDGSVRASVAAREQPGNVELLTTSFDSKDQRFSCSFGASYREFAVADARSGRVVSMIAVAGRVSSANRWSPDGSMLLFATWKLVPSPSYPGGECFEDGPPTWQTWSQAGIRDVPDLRALLQQWDGPRSIDLICNGKPVPMEYPLNASYLVCENAADTPAATLVIGGKPIDKIHQAAIVGFIE